MDTWSMVVGSASVIALLGALGFRARQGRPADQRQLRNVLLGSTALVVAVGVIAFVWTVTRPN